MTRKTTTYARKRKLRRAIPKGSRMAVDALKGNGLDTYKLHNTLFTREEVDKLMNEARKGLQAMRQGLATYSDFASLESAATKGAVIEDAGNIITGLALFYIGGAAALAAIKARATQTSQWVPPTLYGAEIEALDSLVWAYGEALKVCTFKEFYDCQEVAINRARLRGENIYQTGDQLEYPQHDSN